MPWPEMLSKQVTPQRVGLLSAAVPSPYGDALGLLADGAGYLQDPKSLTVGSGLLSLAGLVPGVPAGMGSAKKAMKKAEWFSSDLVSDFVFDSGRYIPDGQRLGREDWLEMFDAYKSKYYSNGERLPVALQRLKKALKEGDISDDLNNWLASANKGGDPEAVWKTIAQKTNLPE